MTAYEFNLHLSAEEYLHYYKGAATSIQVKSFCGKIIQFPAEKMRQYVLAEGIHGTFSICLDNSNKFVSVKKIK